MAFLIRVMRLTGPGFVKLLVAPVALYYFITSPDTRKESKFYLTRLVQTGKRLGESVNLPRGPLGWLAFRHVLSFSTAMVDRVYAWSEGSSAIRYNISESELMDKVLGSGSPGALFLISHLGNFDLAIARSEVTPDKKFNIVMDTSHTRTFNQFRDRIFESGQVRFIEPKNITPLETMSLVERVANGEVVIIAADRVINTNEKNNVMVEFLGEKALFPSGPYILAHVLKVPVYLLFALKKNNSCLLKLELFDQKVIIPRKHRERAIAQYAKKYASRLEQECFKFPLQWFNFYDFWIKPKVVTKNRYEKSL